MNQIISLLSASFKCLLIGLQTLDNQSSVLFRLAKRLFKQNKELFSPEGLNL